MYKVKISKTVYKFIKSRPLKFREIIFEAFDKIAANPFDSSLDTKRLKNKENHYRLRVGKYRILFEILKDEVLIYFYSADSRGDVYKKR